MPNRKITVKLSPISRQITKAQRKLKAARRRVAPKHRKRIDLKIRALHKIQRLLSQQCPENGNGIMSVLFPLPRK